MAVNLFNFLEPKIGQQKYYHDNSTFNQDLTVCGSTATFGESFILGQSIMCGDVTLAVNALEKNPKPPNLFVSGDTTLGRNLTVVNSSFFNNMVTINKNLIVNGKLTIAGVADVAAEIQLAKTLPSPSDERLKENIHTITDPIAKVCALRGVSYDLIKDQKKQIGVIAQEVEQVIPEVVADIPDGYKGVHYGNLVGLLIEAIKEQQKQIDELKEKLEKINE
jgi:hypothetical protein